MLGFGVIDPVKVMRSAVSNAASVASMILTTESLVAEKKEKKSAAPAGGGHGHDDYDYWSRRPNVHGSALEKPRFN